MIIDVASVHGAPPPVATSARFDRAGGSIGRDPSCTLVLPDPEKRISRRHALISFSGDGFRLRNQGSAIAVLLNDVPVDYGAEVPVADGDRIDIGEFSLRVHAPSVATAPVEPARGARSAPPSADILAEFGTAASASDPFADLIPAVPSKGPPAPPPPPARAAGKPPPSAGAIPEDFDPFAEPPVTEPEPPPAGMSGRGGFDDLVPERQQRVDELFGLQGGEPFPPGHPLAAPSASATAGPVGIDDLLTPGAPAANRERPIAPVQRDDAPELGSSMRLPGLVAPVPGYGEGQRERPPAPPPMQAEAGTHRDETEVGPPTVGGMRLSWDERTGDGIFDGKRTAVIGSAAPDRPRVERRRAAPAAVPTTDTSHAEDAASERALVSALLEGLGLQRWPDDHPVDAETMRRLGALLRVAVQGTIDLLRARALIKSEVQAQMTMIVSRDNNPLKFSPNAEAALTHLLGPAQRGFMSAGAAMEDAYRDLVSHQFGFTAGTRAALGDVLNRFDPAKLEARLAAKSMLDALLPAHRKAKLWDLFTERFAQISAEAEDDFQRILGKEFVRAYEEQVAKMSAPERSSEN